MLLDNYYYRIIRQQTMQHPSLGATCEQISKHDEIAIRIPQFVNSVQQLTNDLVSSFNKLAVFVAESNPIEISHAVLDNRTNTRDRLYQYSLRQDVRRDPTKFLRKCRWRKLELGSIKIKHDSKSNPRDAPIRISHNRVRPQVYPHSPNISAETGVKARQLLSS